MEYDLAIIGAGWAGFNAALEAKKLGLRTALIEKSEIGGTCLNLGCIPTKTLIQSAKVFVLARKAGEFGIQAEHPAFLWQKIQERKERIVLQLRQAMGASLAGIGLFPGEAKLLSAGALRAGGAEITAKAIIIAAGSAPAELPFLKFDGKKVISSKEILSIENVPASLLIIGGGVIGCEFASLFAAFGSKVEIAEKLPRLLPGEDEEVSRRLETIFKKRGIKVNTGCDAVALKPEAYEKVLVCVGRVPNTAGMGLSEAGVKLDRAAVAVDEFLRTSAPGVFAAGDCTGKLMLAHFAAHQGVIACRNAAGQKRESAASVVPRCVYADPEVASVGIGSQEAQAKGIEAVIGKVDFLASGMARIIGETDGFIKITARKDNDEILGASIIGPRATELIAVAGVAIARRMTVGQLREVIFAHPTLSELIRETVSAS
jgi:dihydrolipoamide dehydrogenase